LILTTEKGSKFNHDILVINVEESDEFVKGTTVIIQDWNWEVGDFSDRFMFSSDDDRIIFTNSRGSVLEQNALFVRGVYVKDLDEYAFGYQIDSMSMNRDRKVVSEWDIQCAVGNIWREAKSTYAWKLYFEQVRMGKAERNIYLSHVSDDVAESMRSAFFKVFGDSACLETSEDDGREAEHRGAKVIPGITFGYNLMETMVNIVKTDAQYIAERGGIKPKKVKTSHLNSEQKRILSSLRRMAKKVGCDFGVEFAEIPAGGHCSPSEKMIRIHVNHSNDVVECQSIMIHELAHAVFNTVDVTDAHVDACCKIGALLIN